MKSPIPPPARQSVLFLGHGSPMNAIEDNRWSRAFRALGSELPRPRAILSVSAHWFVRGSFVTVEERPKTIHDFGGFPDELFAMEYPAPGAPGLARRVRALAGAEVGESTEWGLDHGTWSVLHHLFPAADVPVVQLSLDARLAPGEHLLLAQRLAPLSEEGVLVLGSGNAVHNLRDAFARMGEGDDSVPEWAAAFDRDVADACVQHDLGFVARALSSANGRAAHPTPDHYLPLVYALGAAPPDAEASFPIEGFDHSLSMRTVRFG
jgi:4,5-DOPA dioxygenase extradiol